jgi:hypothetical protein
VPVGDEKVPAGVERVSVGDEKVPVGDERVLVGDVRVMAASTELRVFTLAAEVGVEAVVVAEVGLSKAVPRHRILIF